MSFFVPYNQVNLVLVIAIIFHFFRYGRIAKFFYNRHHLPYYCLFEKTPYVLAQGCSVVCYHSHRGAI